MLIQAPVVLPRTYLPRLRTCPCPPLFHARHCDCCPSLLRGVVVRKETGLRRVQGIAPPHKPWHTHARNKTLNRVYGICVTIIFPKGYIRSPYFWGTARGYKGYIERSLGSGIPWFNIYFENFGGGLGCVVGGGIGVCILHLCSKGHYPWGCN